MTASDVLRIGSDVVAAVVPFAAAAAAVHGDLSLGFCILAAAMGTTNVFALIADLLEQDQE